MRTGERIPSRSVKDCWKLFKRRAAADKMYKNDTANHPAENSQSDWPHWFLKAPRFILEIAGDEQTDAADPEMALIFPPTFADKRYLAVSLLAISSAVQNLHKLLAGNGLLFIEESCKLV